jgi:hypothetical protein
MQEELFKSDRKDRFQTLSLEALRDASMLCVTGKLFGAQL